MDSTYKQIVCMIDNCRYNKNGDCFSDDDIPILMETRGCGNYEPKGPALKVLPWRWKTENRQQALKS